MPAVAGDVPVRSHVARPSEQLHHRTMSTAAATTAGTSTTTRIVIEPATPPRPQRAGYHRVQNSSPTRATGPMTPKRRRTMSSANSVAVSAAAGASGPRRRHSGHSKGAISVQRVVVWATVVVTTLCVIVVLQVAVSPSSSSGKSRSFAEEQLDLVRGAAVAAEVDMGAEQLRDLARLPPRKPVYRPDHLPPPAETEEHDRPPDWVKVVEPLEPPRSPAESHVQEEEAAVEQASGRYLLVAWMGEQETKAQAHLYQLGLLAVALNRTLVLPRVRKSRFGTCYHHDFSLYYAADSLSVFGIPYITHDAFVTYTAASPHVPTAQLVALVRGTRTGPDDASFMPLNNFCLDSAVPRMSLAEYPPRAFFSPLNDYKSPAATQQFADDVVRTLLDDDEDDLDNRGGADVLVFQYNLRYPWLTPESAVSYATPRPNLVMPQPYDYFAYSPHWTTLGTNLAAALTPYVAVHWRTETLPTTLLAPCGSALIRRLQAVQARFPEIKTVYLAMDYPIESLGLEDGTGKASGEAHSGTMNKVLSANHHEAMRVFLAEWRTTFGIGAGAKVRLTSLLNEQGRGEEGGVELPLELKRLLPAHGRGLQVQDLDPAIVGIVDKIVLGKAQVFIAGLSERSPQQCAKSSQFTAQVVAGREAILALDPASATTTTTAAAASGQDDRSGVVQEDGEQGRGRGQSSSSSLLWNTVGHFSLDGSEDD